jgi:hypothetical protein
MNLPDTLTFGETADGTGEKAIAFCNCRDREGHGVHMQARRPHGGARFVKSFWCECLPGQTFSSYKTLCAAAALVIEDQVAAERAKYPFVRSAEPVGQRSYSNKCRLCAWGDDYGGSRKDGVLIVHLATSWRPTEDRYTELCEDHQHIAQDLRALSEALDAEVAKRGAKAAAKGMPW